LLEGEQTKTDFSCHTKEIIQKRPATILQLPQHTSGADAEQEHHAAAAPPSWPEPSLLLSLDRGTG